MLQRLANGPLQQKGAAQFARKDCRRQRRIALSGALGVFLGRHAGHEPHLPFECELSGRARAALLLFAETARCHGGLAWVLRGALSNAATLYIVLCTLSAPPGEP